MYYTDYLEHYGILGMKWGVRRTPEQLGHKPRTSTEKWKVKQLNEIDRLYNKSFKKLDRAAKENPDDDSISKYRKQLEQQHSSDRKKIEKMSFVDVESARESEREERAAKRKEMVKTAGDAAMWTARMALLGVRIGGTVAVINVLSDAGKTAIDFITSPEGQAALAKGADVVTKIGNGELTALGVAKNFITRSSPNSNFGRALSSVNIEGVMPGANYMPPEQLASAMEVKIKDLA